MEDDAQLLRRYLDGCSQEAFTELVRRHVNLVYFAALRRVGGDSHLADDVSQKVFADLSQKAPSLANRPALAGWLYTSTRFAAAQAVRGERRRRTRELEAHTVNELNATPGAGWEQLRPIIDDAMDELNDVEREAVLLRYFEGRPLAEVGARFSLSPDAARMRVERALDKLRGLLEKRGIASSAAALGAAFANQSSLAAPAGLAAKIAARVLRQGGAAAGTMAGMWKILVGAAAAGLGVAFVFHEARTARVSAIAAAAQEVAVEALPMQAKARAVETASPAIASNVPPAQAAPQPAQAGTVGGFSGMQKFIMKRLWELEMATPNTFPKVTAFRINPQSPDFLEFEAEAGKLRRMGLVGIKPDTGAVFLTRSGVDFCASHAQEIEAD